MSPTRLRPVRILIILLALLPLWSHADDVQLRPDHPERYTVVKGDTLWDIASRFLKTPWHWPRIWKINERIQNPHLIYPGDVLVLRYVNGEPELTLLRNEKLSDDKAAGTPQPSATAVPVGSTTRLQPRVYTEAIERAIPTISPEAIVPFLTQPLVVGKEELERAGYVTVGLDNRIALGDHSEFYARGITDQNAEYFQIFRPGKALKHPDTGEILAYEAIYLGDAKRLAAGDPMKIVVTTVKQEIVPADRLLVAPPRAALPYYFPHAPKKQLTGQIIAALNAVAEVGPYTVVAVDLGERDGIEEGHVLRALYRAGDHKDPVSGERYKLPDEEAGLLLVFRTFEKVSYALVMNANQPIHILDTVATP